MFGKLAFWKKRDSLDDIDKELGLDKNLGMDFTSEPSPDLGTDLASGAQPQQPYPRYPPFQQNSPGFQQPYQQPTPSFNNDSGYINSKNLEVISSKLDALRAYMDSMNQRLANIEAIARGEEENRRKRYF